VLHEAELGAQGSTLHELCKATHVWAVSALTLDP
jgi:hypothetical protein